MIFSCKYDSSGKILEWCKGSSLIGANDLTHSNSGIPSSFGIVSKYPNEVLQNPEQWALNNLRIKNVNSNDTVEVELA
jgi:hypothetical protein